MTVPMSSIAETIADKMHLPKSEYACCIEFDKESSQLETAIRILSNAKSLIGLSKKIKVKSAMKSELSKERAYINEESTTALDCRSSSTLNWETHVLFDEY